MKHIVVSPDSVGIPEVRSRERGFIMDATEHLSHHTSQFVRFCNNPFIADFDGYSEQDLHVR